MFWLLFGRRTLQGSKFAVSCLTFLSFSNWDDLLKSDAQQTLVLSSFHQIDFNINFRYLCGLTFEKQNKKVVRLLEHSHGCFALYRICSNLSIYTPSIACKSVGHSSLLLGQYQHRAYLYKPVAAVVSYTSRSN